MSAPVRGDLEALVDDFEDAVLDLERAGSTFRYKTIAAEVRKARTALLKALEPAEQREPDGWGVESQSGQQWDLLRNRLYESESAAAAWITKMEREQNPPYMRAVPVYISTAPQQSITTTRRAKEPELD